MRHIRSTLAAALLVVAPCALAADYVLSPDGSAVVRLLPQGATAASTFDASLLPSGWTVTTASGGNLSLTSYDAGFKENAGGAVIRALFDRGRAPLAGQQFEWVQVVDTDHDMPLRVSPHLDNGLLDSSPFYTYTAVNRNPALPAEQLNFYDFSRRPATKVEDNDTVTWNASLYPVEYGDDQVMTVYDGMTWGWEMKKATIGTTTGSFSNPGPDSATFSGAGTSTFSWGTGEQSWLSFEGASFDTMPGEVFKLGTLTFHNGTIGLTTGAEFVDFSAHLSFDNVHEMDFSLDTTFTMTNTPNVGDIWENADQVTLGRWGYTFNVMEGFTSSVDIMATLTAGMSGDAEGVDAAIYDDSPLDPSPTYSLQVVSLVNVTDGGFVTAVPEPPIYAIMLAGLGIIALSRKKTRMG